MQQRVVAGLFHPFIQTGYGAEFGSDAMIAEGLAQAAVHSPYTKAPTQQKSQSGSTPPHTLLQILRLAYDSEIMKPVMPYDPDALLGRRGRDASEGGRPEEIARLTALWFTDGATEPAPGELEKKQEELVWLSTLLFVGTGKPGRKPRLDFFLMHINNATLFLPSILKLLNAYPRSQLALLKDYLTVILMTLLIRGRPRIDPALLMSYTATPHPPPSQHPPILVEGALIGDPTHPGDVNPWLAILSAALHAEDSHTTKAIRALFYASQRYGLTAAGALGSAGVGKEEEGQETHKGINSVDGTLFLRAAGVIIQNMGWVDKGEAAGNWDRSALGWDAAWENGE